MITGAGGFIAGKLARHFRRKGFTRHRAVDKKPLNERDAFPAWRTFAWIVARRKTAIGFAKVPVEVYNLAADMGGMGFIERFRVECLRSILINTQMIEAAYRAGARRYFFFSSLCKQFATARSRRPRAEGIGRLPCDGRARIRLGKARVRNVLRGVLG